MEENFQTEAKPERRTRKRDKAGLVAMAIVWLLVFAYAFYIKAV